MRTVVEIVYIFTNVYIYLINTHRGKNVNKLWLFPIFWICISEDEISCFIY